jgi:hypothetical protein
VVEWGWGSGHRFSEQARFRVRDEQAIDEEIAWWLPRMVSRYAFDCGQLDRPLNPWVYQIVVTPVGRREYRSVQYLHPVIERLVAERRTELEARRYGTRSTDATKEAGA